MLDASHLNIVTEYNKFYFLDGSTNIYSWLKFDDFRGYSTFKLTDPVYDKKKRKTSKRSGKPDE